MYRLPLPIRFRSAKGFSFRSAEATKETGNNFELSPVSDDIPVEKLKSICSVLDDEPVLSKELLKLAEFMKEHYFCTYYDAVKQCSLRV